MYLSMKNGFNSLAQTCEVHTPVSSVIGISCFPHSTLLSRVFVLAANFLQIDYDEAIFLWRVDKKDFLLWLAASLFTLFLGIEVGVLIGVSHFHSFSW